MLLDYQYWYFSGAMSDRYCDHVIKYSLSKPDQLAHLGSEKKEEGKPFTKEQLEQLYQKRKSNIVWLKSPWITKDIFNYLQMANKNANWNFKIDSYEDVQFTKYNSGQYYGWHQDGFTKPHNKPGTDLHNKTRKLSAICQLSDPQDYENGQIQFDTRNYDPHLRDENTHVINVDEIKQRGSIIVFPSFLWHRVLPVTKGVRYSLVLWACGDPFK